MQNDEQGHVCDDSCRHEATPRGEAAHGWVWIVGIIVVVAVILFLLQSNVPDVAVPAEESPAAEETVPAEGSEAPSADSTVPSDSPSADESAAPEASDSVRVELEGATE